MTSGDAGEVKFRTPRQKITDYVQRLVEFRNTKGIPHPASRPIDHYLSMGGADFRKCTREDLQEISCDLSSYAYYLKDLHNRQVASLNFCRDYISRAVGQRLRDYQDVYADNWDRRMMIIMDDPDLREFHEMEMELKGYVQHTDGLTAQLNYVAKSVGAIIFSKG